MTDNGKPLAKLLPNFPVRETPYFARGKRSAAFERLERTGRLAKGRDSTIGISEDREDRDL